MEHIHMQEAEGVIMNSVATVTPPVEVGFGAIHAPEMEDLQAQEVCETVQEKYLVKVADGAPSCCIDGRDCVHCLDGSTPEPGAKVAGGALITAYAAAELAGWFEPSDPKSSSERMKLVNAALKATGIVPGGHCDSKAASADFANNGTGCGANDKLPEIIANMGKAPEMIVGGTQLLMGSDTYNSELAETVVQNGIENPITDWRALAMVDVLGRESKKNIEVLDNNGDATGGHHEIMVIINPNEGTTVDRDRMIADGNPQVFVIDTWYIDKLARALARGPEAETQYQMLKHAMTAYQVATLITLGDGSHRIGQLARV